MGCQHAKRIVANGTVHPKEVELDGLDSLFLLADDLRVLSSRLGVRARRTGLRGLNALSEWRVTRSELRRRRRARCTMR